VLDKVGRIYVYFLARVTKWKFLKKKKHAVFCVKFN